MPGAATSPPHFAMQCADGMSLSIKSEVIIILLLSHSPDDGHKQTLWKTRLDAHWDHRHNTHILWKTKHGLSGRAPPPTLNNSITFNNKITNTPKHIANCFTEQFTNTVKHATHKTNKSIDRSIQKIQENTLHLPQLRSKRQ